MPKCTINGKEIEVKEGTTVIEAFKKVEQDIAHYCWHPGLKIAGVCRLCMCEVEGNPRLQIACNTTVQDGMVVSNQTEKVKDTVKWGLDFHLINHPLDCPICDQAGECELQNQYMKFGQYDPEMAEPKVKKRKAVSLGPTVMLDTERCILCSRCVRFTEEVTKTNELGIFNRGDRSEIGTFKDKPLDNNYSYNTVDICPVGALTSKDFRFRQRVWYLKEHKSICTGCSTGCNVNVYYNEEGLFRVRPVHNENVNGYWMCDKGRDVYKFVNKEYRLYTGKIGQKDNWQPVEGGEAAIKAGETLRGADKGSTALILTGQQTNEEYESILKLFKDQLNNTQVYHWINNPDSFEDFDDILFRGDRNPNTKGLLEALAHRDLNLTWDDFKTKLEGGKIKTLVVVGPENQEVFPDMDEKIDWFSSKAENLIWLSAGKNEKLDQVSCQTWQIPLKTYFEKDGSFINHKGDVQKITKGATIVAGALTLEDASQLMAGEAYQVPISKGTKELKQNHYISGRGSL